VGSRCPGGPAHLAMGVSRRHEVAVQQLLDSLVQLCAGVWSFAMGLVLVGQTIFAPHMLTSGRLIKDLWFTPAVVTWVAFVSAWLWILARPLKWMGLMDPAWRDLAQVASLVALVFMREFMSGVSSSWFFHVLSTHDLVLSDRIRAQPIVFGLREKLKGWSWSFVAGVCGIIGVTVLFSAFGAVIGPAIAAAASAAIAAWPIVLIVTLVVAALIAMLGGAAYLYKLVGPIVRLFRFDPVMGCIILVIVACGLTSTASVTFLMKTGTLLYYSCTVLTAQLLSGYGERLQQADWEAFQRQHCWQMFGFGLPIWALTQCSPIAVVLMLQLFQGASARLLADILGKPDQQRVP